MAHPLLRVLVMRPPRRLSPVVGFALSLAACGGSTAAIGNGGDGGGGVDGAAVGDGATLVLDCQPDGGATGTTGSDPSVQDTLHGTNGVFTDACDSMGNLVDYSCETLQTCGPGPNPDCTPYETGKVISTNLDCAGHCVDGRCDGRCPTESQRITFTSSADGAGNIAIHNDTAGRSYVCIVLYDNPGDSFDCTTGPHAGLQGTVTGLGLHGDWCTGKDFGNIAVSVDGAPSPTFESCAFGCGIW